MEQGLAECILLEAVEKSYQKNLLRCGDFMKEIDTPAQNGRRCAIM
jgi:hypothetical protein